MGTHRTTRSNHSVNGIIRRYHDGQERERLVKIAGLSTALFFGLARLALIPVPFVGGVKSLLTAGAVFSLYGTHLGVESVRNKAIPILGPGTIRVPVPEDDDDEDTRPQPSALER